MTICNLENNLVWRASITKIILLSGSNMENYNLVAAVEVQNINLESKRLIL